MTRSGNRRQSAKPVKVRDHESREEDITFGKFRLHDGSHVHRGPGSLYQKLIAWHASGGRRVGVRVIGISTAWSTRFFRHGRQVDSVTVTFGASLPHSTRSLNKLAEHAVQPLYARLPLCAVSATTPSRSRAFSTRSPNSWARRSAGLAAKTSEGIPRVQTLLHTVAQMSDWPRRDGTAFEIASRRAPRRWPPGSPNSSSIRFSALKVHHFCCEPMPSIAVQLG